MARPVLAEKKTESAVAAAERILSRPNREATLFVLLLIGYCAYALLFIYRTSFVVDGERYFTLFDDAMISMRYAKNLAHGYGLVWNPVGERVEGFTNLLWVLYMALFHLLPIAASKVSLFIQLTAAGLLAVNLILVRKITRTLSDGSWFVSLAAVAFTAFYIPINTWSLQGMEVAVLTPLVSASILLTVRAVQNGRFTAWPYVLLGFGTVIRLDTVVCYLVVLLFSCLADHDNRRRQLLIGALILLLLLVTQTMFRIAYYGDPLPNTYYLKMTGYPLLLRISTGIFVTLTFIWKTNWLLFLLPFLFVLKRRSRFTVLLASFVVAQLLYSVYVGGDAWEGWGGSNRYVSVVMPAFFVLFAMSLESVVSALARGVEGSLLLPGMSVISAHRNVAKAALVFILLVSFNALNGPQTLPKWLLINRPLHSDENSDMVKAARAVKAITDDDATIAVVWAGAIPYFADRYAVDLLGKNDRTIAHQAAHVSKGIFKYTGFYPGHNKWDFGYSVGELRPDVVVQVTQPEALQPYLKAEYRQAEFDGTTLFLRDGSSHVLWERVTAAD